MITAREAKGWVPPLQKGTGVSSRRLLLIRNNSVEGCSVASYVGVRRAYDVSAPCLGSAGDESTPTTCGADTLEQAGGAVYKYCEKCPRRTAV